MVQVGNPQLPGYGGMAAPKPGYGFGPENYVPEVGGNGGNGGNGNGNGGNGGNGNGNGAVPGAIGGFGVPNNFWGFVMLMMGLR